MEDGNDDDNYYNSYRLYRKNYLYFNIFEVYRSEILNRVNPQSIYPYFRDIFDHMPPTRTSQHMDIFLQELEKLCTLQLLEKFLEALKKLDYTALLNLLTGDDELSPYHEHCLEKIKENTPVLSRHIDPFQIASDLLAKKCINESEYQNIVQLKKTEGDISAATHLLFVIHMYHKNWYDIFLKTLEENNGRVLIERCGLDTIPRANSKVATASDGNRPKGMYIRQNQRKTAVEHPEADIENGVAKHELANDSHQLKEDKIQSVYEQLEPSTKCNERSVYGTLDISYDDCLSVPPPVPPRIKDRECGEGPTASEEIRTENSCDIYDRRDNQLLRNPSIMSRLSDASQQGEVGDSASPTSIIQNLHPHACRWPLEPGAKGRQTYNEDESKKIIMQLKGVSGFIERGDCQCEFLNKPCKDGSYYIWVHEEFRIVVISVRYAQTWRFFKIHRSRDALTFYVDKRVFRSKNICELLAYYERYGILEKLSNGNVLTVRLLFPWGSGVSIASMIS